MNAREVRALPSDIWAGWAHLDGQSQRFGSLVESKDASLLQSQLSDTATRVLDKVAELAPQILPVSAVGTTLDPTLFDQLLVAIGELVDGAETRFWYLRRFLEIIDHGNHSGRYEIPISRVPLPPIPQPASPFQHGLFEAAVALKPLISDFLDSLRLPAPTHPEARWGRVMLSAMLFGGLPRARWLLVLPKALSQDTDPTLRWLDLVIENVQRESRTKPADRKRHDSEPSEPTVRVLRRWFPDPLTRLLLREIRSSLPEAPVGGDRATDSSLVYKVVTQYLVECGVNKHLPTSLRKLADAIETRMQQFVPRYLVQYAFENIDSTSLSAPAWRRLVDPPQRLTKHSRLYAPPREFPASKVDSDDEIRPGASQLFEKDASTTESDTPANELELWPQQLRELRLIIRRDFLNARTRIRAWQDEHASDLLPSVRWIASWIVDDLLAKRPRQKPKRPSTIYQFLRTAGAGLVSQLAGNDPATLGDEDDYADLYEDVLDDVSNTSMATRRTAVNALRSFHRFLMTNAATVPEVEDTGVFVVSGHGVTRVDANLVDRATYFLALRELKQANTQHHSDEVIEALSRIMGLGYFASLRRSEAIGLTLGDVIMAGDEVILEVRRNPLRPLKTDNAWRRLPLHVLMPKAELTVFQAWVRRRQAAVGGDREAPLFPMFVRDAGVRAGDSRLRLIVDALQAATGDPTVRFHHLRHSFATWQMVQFWIADQRARHLAIPTWFLPTDHSSAHWRIAKRARDELLGTAPTNRRSLLQVSQLLGHGSAEITLGSYVHLLDFLLGQSVRRLAPILDFSTLAVLTRESEEALRRLHKRHARNAPVEVDDGNAIWLDQVVDGPPRRGRPRRQPRPLPTVDFRAAAKLAPPVETYARLMYEMEAVNDWLATPEEGRNGVATRYDLPRKLLSSAAEALQFVPQNMNTNFLRSGATEAASQVSSVSGMRYAPPQGKAQEDLARCVLACVEGMRSKATTAGAKQRLDRKIAFALHAFIEHWMPGTYLAARFHRVRHAREWLWLLQQIELGSKNVPLDTLVRATHVPGKGPSTPRALVQRVYWLRQIHRKPERATTAQLAEHANPHTRGMVLIDINRPKLASPSSPSNRVANFEGVRLALLAIFCRLPVSIRKLVVAQGKEEVT